MTSAAGSGVRPGSLWRTLAAVASVAAWVQFGLGATHLVLSGVDPWRAGFTCAAGVWGLVLARYALAGSRPEIGRRMGFGLLGAAVGGVLGLVATPVLASALAPGSETAPTLVAIAVLPLASTLGLLVGWLVAARSGSR